MKSSSSVYGLPRSHWHCHLSNYKHDPAGNLEAHTEHFTQLITANKHPHVLMTGPPGTGKTHLGVGLWRWAVAELGDIKAATWVHIPSFCDTVKRTYGLQEGQTPDVWQEFTEVRRRLYILDDIAGRELTPHEVNNILARLIGIVYEQGAALVMTTNLSVEELGTIFHPHEMSRMLADGEVWQFTGEDHRL